MAANADEKAPEASGLALDSIGTLYLDGLRTDTASLAMALREKMLADSTHHVLIAAHKGLRYEEVTALLDQVRGTGVRKYALMVARPQ